MPLRCRTSGVRRVAYERVASGEAQAEVRASRLSPHPQTFLTAKLLMLRALGAVYLAAFLSAYHQNRALIGSNGLRPAPQFVSEPPVQGPWDGFIRKPAIWWWWPLSDDRMDAVALVGTVLSAAVCLGLCSSIAMFSLWLLYFSIVSAADGSTFYAYGWESQLLETGFLAILLCDLRPWKLHRGSAPSSVVMWLFRWLIFRISLGAGLIKMRGGSCWAERTCLWYHFETQPIPSPSSFVFHFLPRPVLSAAIDLDLFVQLYSSWLVLVPGIGPLRWLRRVGGFIQAAFMLNIALSGNLSFLNHLTIIPALACLDDSCWPKLIRAAEPTSDGSRRWK
ncbi:MAG: hypothetical protein SGPRY_012731, partial [Prymnesium sp.]